MTKNLKQLEALVSECMEDERPDVQERHRCAGARARQLETTGRIYYRGGEARALLDALELTEYHRDDQAHEPMTTAELLLAAAMLAARASGEELPAPRLLIALEGGCVSGTVADVAGVDVTVIDYDTEGADAYDLYAIPQDGGGTAEAWRSHHGAADVDPAFIDRALAAEIADPEAAAAELRKRVADERARAAKLEPGEHRTMIETAADALEREAARLEALIAEQEGELTDSRRDPLRHVEIADAE